MIDRSLAQRTREVYERNAQGWDRHRPKVLFERSWLESFLAIAPASAPVLDVGCGAGDPIARFCIDAGRAVHGVDFAESMLELCRARFPAQRWSHADMRTLDLGRDYGGVIAWDSVFHLTMAEQRDCLPRLAAHVGPGGALMFTCGPEAGEVTGTVEGELVYHASLDPAEYRDVLAAAGLEVEAFVANDPTCGEHTVCLARRG